MAGVEGVHWAMVLDGIQILLCLLILVYLVRVRRRAAGLRSGPGAEAAAPDFAGEMILEAARRQVEDALDAVVGRIEDERLRLQEALTESGLRPLAGGKHFAPPRGKRPPSGEEPAAAAEPRAGRYSGVSGLAAGGLDSRQISEKLRLPAGEVELVLQLQRAVAREDGGDSI